MINRKREDRIFDLFNTTVLLIITFLTLYPFAYVVFASFSAPIKIMGNQGVLFWPDGFSLAAYRKVFGNPSIYIGYGNTIFYVVAGTTVKILMTSMGACVLSRDGFMLRWFFPLMFIFTMYFSGGLIPTYLQMNQLGAMTGDNAAEDVGTTIKYATILVSVIPILCVYPLIQKHFVKGVMIGAVKG